MPIKFKLLAAFGVIYFVWGSTYFAIKVAVDSLPPFLMMGFRFLGAGLLMLCFTVRRNRHPLTRRHWRTVAVLALTMVVTGTGIVAWVEVYLPSGLTALIVSISPVWLVSLEVLHPKGRKPGPLAITGMVIGILGVILLIGPGNLVERADLGATAVLLFASFSWSVGSIYSRHNPIPASPIHMTALQMALGGAVLCLLGGLFGEFGQIQWSAVSATSIGAFAYLLFIGSIIVFPIYIWLMKVSTPALVGTHAFINPVVALLLGWFLGGEQMNTQMLIAAAVIVTAVILVTGDHTRGRKNQPRGNQGLEVSGMATKDPPIP